MCQWGNQDREALALDIEELYGNDPDSSTTVERIVEYIRAWRK